jgi:hypothetical protein
MIGDGELSLLQIERWPEIRHKGLLKQALCRSGRQLHQKTPTALKKTCIFANGR